MKTIFGAGVGRWLRNEAAVTSIEYAMLGSLIGAAVAGAVSALGTAVLSLWTLISDALASL